MAINAAEREAFERSDGRSAPGRPDPAGASRLWLVALVLAALTIGVLIGRGLPGGAIAQAADESVDATATRAAELTELDELRTKVAQPVYCTPMPSPTPTETATPVPPTATATLVPPQGIGVEVVDSQGLGVTILSIQPVQAPDGVDANGQLMRLNVRLSNTTDSPLAVPFVDWRLVDAAGNRYSVHIEATGDVVGPTWAVAVGAHETDERAVVFDVAADAGGSFVLEHDEDQTFRIQVVMESRG